jgi:hypothetical protein
LVVACSSNARHQVVAMLPRTEEARDYPAANKLEVVNIDPAEWKAIAKRTRAIPCDRHARSVARDELALVNEAFRALAADGGPRLLATCSDESVRVTVGERELDLDFLRAAVERDARGKLVRFHGFSARNGRLVRGVFHLEKKQDKDGVVVLNLQRYLPTELGRVYMHRVEDREELYVTSKGHGETRGLFVVSRAWGEDDELVLGIARYAVGGK